MSIRDRLRLVFRKGPAAPADPLDPAPFHEPPEIEFVAYAEDCRLFGHTRLDADRLTDMLNQHEEVELVDVAMEALGDGRIVEVRSMVVARDELLVVQASGPRGARERRHRTRPHPVAVQSGPYLVRGHLHALPTADPFGALRRRPPMVPLTEGSIAYTVGGGSVMRRTDTIIVNRTVIDWIVPSTDEEVRFPELPVSTGILVKDFTGQIYDLRERVPVDRSGEPETEPVPSHRPAGPAAPAEPLDAAEPAAAAEPGAPAEPGASAEPAAGAADVEAAPDAAPPAPGTDEPSQRPQARSRRRSGRSASAPIRKAG